MAGDQIFLVLLRAIRMACVPYGGLRGRLELIEALVSKGIVPREFARMSDAELDDEFRKCFAADKNEGDFWRVDVPSRFQRDFEILGDEVLTGAFGTVRKCRSRLDGAIYAVKTVDIPHLASAASIKRILREVTVLAKMNHKHVTRYYHAWVEILEDVKTPDVSPEKSRAEPEAGNATEGSEEDSFLKRYAEEWDALNNSTGCWRELSKTEQAADKAADEYQEDEDEAADEYQAAAQPDDEDEAAEKAVNRHQAAAQQDGEDEAAEKAANKHQAAAQGPPSVGKRLYIVMEYVPLRLADFLNDQVLHSKLDKLSVLKQLLDALDHVHGMGLVHRDLAPKNVLLDNAYNVKLADFGLCKSVDVKPAAPETLGTPYYVAPEVMRRSAVSAKADMFSLGIITVELFCFLDTAAKASFFNTRRLPTFLEPAIADLVRRLLDEDPERRPSAAEVLKQLDDDVVPLRVSRCSSVIVPPVPHAVPAA